jgi:hypothetical protein
MSERIYGIVPPMITPFRPDETLDEDAVPADARYLVETARVQRRDAGRRAEEVAWPRGLSRVAQGCGR